MFWPHRDDFFNVMSPCWETYHSSYYNMLYAGTLTLTSITPIFFPHIYKTNNFRKQHIQYCINTVENPSMIPCSFMKKNFNPSCNIGSYYINLEDITNIFFFFFYQSFSFCDVLPPDLMVSFLSWWHINIQTFYFCYRSHWRWLPFSTIC